MDILSIIGLVLALNAVLVGAVLKGAGLMALVVQKTGARQGNANTQFYSLAHAQYTGVGLEFGGLEDAPLAAVGLEAE